MKMIFDPGLAAVFNLNVPNILKYILPSKPTLRDVNL